MADTESIKKLRDMTGLSIKAVKEALEEAGGDMEKAKEILAEHGAEVAEKKAERETKAGLVEAYIHNDGAIGVLVELLCETDFVARNDEFKTLAHNIAMHVAATDPQDQKELLEGPYIKSPEETVNDQIEQAIGVLGENIQMGRFTRFEL